MCCFNPNQIAQLSVDLTVILLKGKDFPRVVVVTAFFFFFQVYYVK